MSAVVDASVLVKALLDAGPAGEWARAIVAGGALHAPDLALAEVTNVLRGLELTKHITTAEANAAHEDLLQLNVELFSFEPFAERAWSLRHNLTSYDAWSVGLAEALGLPLATFDERLAKAKGTSCEFLTPPR
ncbi:MAG TPA: type II toxin-antitoxin system VapC family toxin [Steroidobacteraceae bacterium]|nr:type II toxin-antitoxin system VapC family toxin [Steroidobacteraceae bacterium]